MCVNSPVCSFSAFGATSVGLGNPWVHLPTVNFTSLLLNYSTHWSTKTKLASNMYVLCVGFKYWVLFIESGSNWSMGYLLPVPSGYMKLICSWLQHPGVVTPQTRSHYGAGTDFPCLPALERPKHYPFETFFPKWGAAFHEESLMKGTWRCHLGVQCHC